MEKKSQHTLKAPNRKAHWLVHFLHLQLRLTGMSRSELARRGGYHPKTLEAWWTGEAIPNLQNFENSLRVFAYCLKPSRIDEKTEQIRERIKDDSGDQ